MGHSCRTLLWDTLPAPQILRVLKLYYKVASFQLPAPQIAPRTKVALQSHSSHLPAPQILRGLKLYDKVASARLHFARSTRAISAEGCAGTGQIALSPAFRALETHDLGRGLRTHGTNRTLACISRTRHARSPQRVARAWDKSHSRLHFAHSTRTISAEVKSPKRAFRSRLPQKLTRQSLQNERFVRDFLQKSSGNTHRSTHIRQPCQAVSRFQPLQTTSAHTPIPTATSRFPAPATRIALPRLKARTKSCACHEKNNIISCELQQNLHHTIRLE